MGVIGLLRNGDLKLEKPPQQGDMTRGEHIQ